MDADIRTLTSHISTLVMMLDNVPCERCEDGDSWTGRCCDCQDAIDKALADSKRIAAATTERQDGVRDESGEYQVNVRRVADRDAAIREQTIRSVADMFDLRAQEALVVDTPIGSSAYNAMITARDLVLLMLATQSPSEQRVRDLDAVVARLAVERDQALESGLGYVSHFGNLVRSRDAAEHQIVGLVEAVNFLMNCRVMDADDQTWQEAIDAGRVAVDGAQAALEATEKPATTGRAGRGATCSARKATQRCE